MIFTLKTYSNFKYTTKIDTTQYAFVTRTITLFGFKISEEDCIIYKQLHGEWECLDGTSLYGYHYAIDLLEAAHLAAVKLKEFGNV